MYPHGLLGLALVGDIASQASCRTEAAATASVKRDTTVSELAYQLSTQQRALARDWLFIDQVRDKAARQRHFECAQRLAARLIAGNY